MAITIPFQQTLPIITDPNYIDGSQSFKDNSSSYRSYLQSIANTANDPVAQKEATALLQVVGDDGKLNANFLADPYKYTNSDSGQVTGGYGPKGAQTINDIYYNAYNTRNDAFGGTGGSTAITDAANTKASYQDQMDNLDRLLGHTATLKQQAMQGAEDQYASTKSQQEKIFNDQRTQNTQNQEKGYNEVGNFANTSYNNLNRLLQGANAGRSSVGQVLAPFMVGRAADTRRKSVTDTAGENMRNIDTTAETTFNDLFNTKKKSLQDYETNFGNTAQDLTNQRYQAQLGRDMANGATYAQARAGATSLENDMTNRYAQLAGLFDKYKPNYTTKEAPALNTYQVDPAQINAGQNSSQDNSFYLNQLKRKKELGL